MMSMKIAGYLKGISSFVTQMAGIEFICGSAVVARTWGFYFTRTITRMVLNPPEQADYTFVDSFLTEKHDEIMLSGIINVVMQWCATVGLRHGLGASAILGAIRSVVANLFNKNIHEAELNIDVNELMSASLKGALKGGCLCISINGLSDYVIDFDDDPTACSQTSLILGGIAGEILYDCIIKAFNKAQSPSESSSLALDDEDRASLLKRD